MQDWSRGWTPPDYQVDGDGKVIGAVNDRAPHNWGRWGELDELGTANLITPEVRRRAAELVTTGEVIGCADTTPDPLGRTHWDGLAHGFDTLTRYNGFRADTDPPHPFTDQLVGRGVLLDLPRTATTDRIPNGHAITARELDECARDQAVELRSGDMLLIRTGELGWYRALDDKADYWTGSHAGLSVTTIDWIHRTEPAAIAIDNRTFEVTPFEPGHTEKYPLHARLIRDLGLLLGELWWLDDLAEVCRRNQRWEFMLSAPPLPDGTATELPVSPLAFF